MAVDLLGLGMLVVAFVLATALPLNLGAVLFAFALVLATVAGVPTAEVFGGFPTQIVVLLIGVTYLANTARRNGTIDVLVAGACRLTRDRVGLTPWVMFALAAVLSAIGVLVAPAVVAPVAMSLAARTRIPQALMGILLVHGAGAGAMSPLSVYGVFVPGLLRRQGIEIEPGPFFLIGFLANLAAAAVVVTVVHLVRRRRPAPGGPAVPAPLASSDVPTGPEDEESRARVTPIVLLTVALIACLIVGAFLGLDVGLLAIAAAVVLALFRPGDDRAAIAAVPWSLIFLVAGTVSYVGVMEHVGSLERFGQAVFGIGSAVVAVLVLGYLAGLTSAVAASTGVMTAVFALALPLLQNGGLWATAVAGYLVVAATMVDVSPFSGQGASVIANATEDHRAAVYRSFLLYGAAVTAVAPFAVWLVVIAL